MTDFSVYIADLIAEWMSQGSDMPSAPGTIYVALFDDLGSELSSNLQNGRVGVTASTGWDLVGTNDFENAAEVDFGEATMDITLSDVALFDSDTGGSDNELARYTLDSAPQSVSDGTRVFFAAGDLNFDVVDRTE